MMIRLDFIEKMMFKPRPEGAKGLNQVRSLGRVVQAEKQVGTKSLRQEYWL